MRPAPVEMGCGNIKNAGRVDRKSLLNHDIDVPPRDRLHPGAGLKSEDENGSKSRKANQLFTFSCNQGFYRHKIFSSLI